MLDIKAIVKELGGIKDMVQLEEFFQKYLGKKGIVTEGFKQMGNASPEEKKELGKTLTEAKDTITEAYEAKERALSTDAINQKLQEDMVDISLDGLPLDQGAYSVLAKVRRNIEEVYRSM
ncbi:MAG: hypothetical protein WCG98_09995 [bacterium]